MPTILPAHKITFAAIIANEANLQVKTKLEQFISTHTANTSYVPQANHLMDIANHSSQKSAIIAFVASLT